MIYNKLMFNSKDIKRIEEKIDKLSDKIDKVLERQNSQYTDIMLRLQNTPGTRIITEDDAEDLFDEAKEIVLEAGKASTSYLQRKLRIGYSAAARVIDLLEERGVVGPANGSTPREVLK
jgi:DNA segregation ATPase FtsK/SpoIIIE-like protein